MSCPSNSEPFASLAAQIPVWAEALGFQQVGIAETDLTTLSPSLQHWLEQGYQGDMAWLNQNTDKRIQPDLLVTGCVRAISVRMNYLPQNTARIKTLNSPTLAYISRYALGRDYHKLIRKRLAELAEKIRQHAEPFMPVNQRPFVDSAPVLERPLAERAGLGWTGKNTLIINEKAGSWFFLGEILTNIPLPITAAKPINRCGSCTACLTLCPTNAFPQPYVLDARRCISYLTIENAGPIPLEFRKAMGNRVFGCDDCQIVCPWNKFAKPTDEQDFHPRHQLDSIELLQLFLWTETEFLQRTQGSPIRRIGYEKWLRNLAVGLGNAPKNLDIIAALRQKYAEVSPLVQEHLDWALQQQLNAL